MSSITPPTPFVLSRSNQLGNISIMEGSPLSLKALSPVTFSSYSSTPSSPLTFPSFLNVYYKTLFLSLLQGNVASFFEAIARGLAHVYDEFVMEKTLLNKKYVTELSTFSVLHGVWGKNTYSGSFTKRIQEANLQEMVDNTNLVLKYRSKLASMFQELYAKFISSIENANSLYTDIYSQDYKLTASAYSKWLDYCSSLYNEKLSEYRLLTEIIETNSKVIENTFLSLKSQLEMMKDRILTKGLDSDKREAFNKYYLMEKQYLIDLERFSYLNLENLKFINQKQATELKSFATYIEKINALTSAVESSLSLFEANYDVNKSKLELVETQASRLKQDIETTDRELSLHGAYIEASSRQNMLEIEKLKPTLIGLQSKISEYEASLKSLILNDVSRAYEEMEKYQSNKFLVLDAMKEEFVVKTAESMNDTLTRIEIDNALDMARSLFSLYTSLNSSIAHSTADWFRSCALASAQITASFVRTCV